MPIESLITDPSNGRQAKVTLGNALAVGPSHTSLSFNGELATDDVVVNVVPAKGEHVFCMTGLLLTGDKNVSGTVDARVNIFVGDSESTALVDAIDVLFTIPVQKSGSRDITGILVETEEGKWVNAVTTDDNVFVTVLGYYLEVE